MEKRYNTDSAGGGGDGKAADDYLSKLAQSILSKDKKGAPPRPGVLPNLPNSPLPIPSSEPVRTSSSSVPRLTPSQDHMRPPSTSQSMVPKAPPPSRTAVPRLSSGASDVSHAGTRDWVREVDYYDERGNFIPGTILVFEDGSLGVFKESNASKEYDIVYMLKNDGRAVPQGMPLYTYEVTPVGRLSGLCLDQLKAQGKWERDMVVFHLLKYKDRVYIPQITEAPPAQIPSSESISRMDVPKLNIAVEERIQPSAESKPALTRGRKLTIEFGAGRRWDAVYWGKDELGYVVAHNTHERWSLMHLDLNRFKDAITYGDIVSGDVQKKMEMDFATA